MAPDKFRVVCDVNGVQTTLGRHRTEQACRRRYFWVRKVLEQVCSCAGCKLTVWYETPAGKVMSKMIADYRFKAENAPPVLKNLLDGLDDPGGLCGPSVGDPNEWILLEPDRVTKWRGLLDRLEATGVDHVFMTYDDLSFEGFSAYDHDGEELDKNPVPVKLAKELMAACLADMIPAVAQVCNKHMVALVIDTKPRQVEVAHEDPQEAPVETVYRWVAPAEKEG
jgi:hypothetical protein